MGNLLTIDLDKCFECSADMDEMHHVVPKIRGGKKTIPLCSKCHGLAHGLHRKGRHAEIVREGARKAKEEAEKLGLPSPYQGRKKGTKDSIEKTLKRHQDIVIELTKGYGVRETSRRLKKSVTTVQKIKNIFKNAGGACEIDIQKSDLVKNH